MSTPTPMHSSKVEDEEEFKVELLPEDYAQYDLSFKLIVIGDSGVGKSCLTNKATKNIFDDTYILDCLLIVLYLLITSILKVPSFGIT